MLSFCLPLVFFFFLTLCFCLFGNLLFNFHFFTFLYITFLLNTFLFMCLVFSSYLSVGRDAMGLTAWHHALSLSFDNNISLVNSSYEMKHIKNVYILLLKIWSYLQQLRRIKLPGQNFAILRHHGIFWGTLWQCSKHTYKNCRLDLRLTQLFLPFRQNLNLIKLDELGLILCLVTRLWFIVYLSFCLFLSIYSSRPSLVWMDSKSMYARSINQNFIFLQLHNLNHLTSNMMHLRHLVFSKLDHSWNKKCITYCTNVTA